MKMKTKTFFAALLLSIIALPNLNAETIEETIRHKAAQVSKLSIGYDDFIIGRKLTDEHKKLAAQSISEKTIKGTYKFQHGDFFVIADRKSDIVLGLLKEKKNAGQEDVKKIIGELMMKYHEPTLMAHDKLVYWAYDEDGKISEQQFRASKRAGGQEALVTVKFSSSQPIFREMMKETGKAEDSSKAQPKSADISVIIHSNPLSALYLAQQRISVSREKQPLNTSKAN